MNNAQFRKWTVYVIGIIMSIYQLYCAFVGGFIPGQQRGLHLAFALVLVAYLYPPKTRNETVNNVLATLQALVGAGAALYIVYQFRAENQLLLVRRGPTQVDVVIATILLLMILLSVQRSTGWALPIIASIFLLYSMVGQYLPGLLSHKGFTWKTMIDILFFSTEGVYGQPLGVSATFVAIFVMFGSFLSVTGCGQWFIDIAYALTGHTRSGPAMTAVVSSAAMGTISGTGVANVVTTGAFTIPLMKKIGYNPVFAGAVEAVASTGGQIMPPVMGAGAFILAEILGVGYGDVAIAAALPAVLYFLACGFQVHFEACKLGLRGMPKSELPDAKSTFLNGLPFLIPIAVLVWALVIARYSASLSGLLSIAVIIVVAIVLKKKGERLKLKDIIDALADAAKGMVPVAMACATAGIIIGVLVRTGLTLRFTAIVLQIANGHLMPALILTMLSCVLLGMGLPTTAAFIVCGTLCAPAVIEMGVPAMGAYLFVFYFACISSITPPVAMAAFAASGISGASALKTGFYATKLGIGGFIVPFYFCYNSALLMQGGALDIVQTMVTSIFGIFCLAVSMENHWIYPIKIYERIMFLAASFLLVDASLLTDVIGLALMLAAVVPNILRNRKGQAPVQAAESAPADSSKDE